MLHTKALSRNKSTGWCTNISGQAFRELDWSNCEMRLSPKGSGEFGMQLNRLSYDPIIPKTLQKTNTLNPKPGF
jgi:hypothetical protein